METGRDRELLTKSLGNTPHLTTLLAGRAAVLRLRESFEGGERNSGSSSGGEEILEDGAAGVRTVWHRRGKPLGRRWLDQPEIVNLILSRVEVKEFEDCCRFS